jgi:DNA invertase Pin-like site-specific DNA recombinase
MNAQELLEQSQFKEALLKYAESYNLKKNRSKNEPGLSDIKKYYVIYARKSTEDDKRQIQSIEDQVEECKKFAKANNLVVVEIIQEEKSAKIAGRRDKFEDMLNRIEKGDLYNSILTWHPDRLSRNMKESGQILDMLDNDLILDLKFPSYTFNNDAAGKMTLSILFAMAKEFSDKLAEDTKRGIRKKVREGKYTGTSKKGYFNNDSGYFRVDEEKFSIYSQAWQLNKEGHTQGQIIDWLNKQGEKIDTNSMSVYFQDPFSAGIYCYGTEVVDLTSVDSKFKPMVSPKDFILLQKMNRGTTKGWRKTDEFRPFTEFVVCGDCGNSMTPGLSTGKSGRRYLNVTCSNKICKNKRRNSGLKPVNNSVRARVIVEFALKAINSLKDIDKDTYEKAKKKYFEEKNLLVKTFNQEISELKVNRSKMESRSGKMADKLVDETSESVSKKLSDDLSILLTEIRLIETQIFTFEQKVKSSEFDMEAEFPNYETFLNFFKDIAGVIESTDNAYLVDQLVKLVFLNITIKDKTVIGYTLQEPFEAYEGLNSFLGWLTGIEPVTFGTTNRRSTS